MHGAEQRFLEADRRCELLGRGSRQWFSSPWERPAAGHRGRAVGPTPGSGEISVRSNIVRAESLIRSTSAWAISGRRRSTYIARPFLHFFPREARMRSLLGVPTALALVVVLIGCGDDDSFSPTVENVSGSYSAASFTLTTVAGTGICSPWARMSRPALAPDGTTDRPPLRSRRWRGRRGHRGGPDGDVDAERHHRDVQSGGGHVHPGCGVHRGREHADWRVSGTRARRFAWSWPSPTRPARVGGPLRPGPAGTGATGEGKQNCRLPRAGRRLPTLRQEHLLQQPPRSVRPHPSTHNPMPSPVARG